MKLMDAVFHSRTSRFITAISMAFLGSVTSVVEAGPVEDLTPVTVAKKVGYIDTQGTMVIAPQFDTARDFSSNGLATIKQNDKWGYIDAQGRMVIAPQYDWCGNFAANGLAAVMQNDKLGFIDAQGNMVIAPQFKSAQTFASNGLAMVMQNDKLGFIDGRGNMVIAPQFDVSRWSHGFATNDLAIVSQHGKLKFINIQGLMAFTQGFQGAQAFAANGLAAVQQDRKWGFIDAQGRMVIPPQFGVTSGFSANGLAAVQQYGQDGQFSYMGLPLNNGKWGYIDAQGNWVIPPQFDWAGKFSANGLAMVRVSQNEKYGIIDAQGHMVIAPKFGQAPEFAANGLIMTQEHGKEGFLNTQGEVVATVEYECGAPVLKNGKGKVTWPDHINAICIDFRKDKEAALMREAAHRKAQEKQALAQAAAFKNQIRTFRQRLSAGDDSHCGLVIEVKKPLVKAQTMIGEHWLKIEQLYPQGAANCRFVNGVYQEPAGLPI